MEMGRFGPAVSISLVTPRDVERHSEAGIERSAWLCLSVPSLRFLGMTSQGAMFKSA